MGVELNEKLLAEIAGWEAMKRARGLLAEGKVLSSNWTPPILRGVVQEGTLSLRSGLAIKSAVDVECLCGCREAREWGTMCAHAVAVGLHHLKKQAVPAPQAAASGKPAAAAAVKAARPARRLQRRAPGEDGPEAQIHVILPPNLEQALERGKVMLCLEGAWPGGRGPLNSLPPDNAYGFSAQDAALLDRLELLAGGDTPALLMIGGRELAEVLECLAGHPRLTLGRANPVTVSSQSRLPPLRATLEPGGAIVLQTKGPAGAAILIENTWLYQARRFERVSLPESCAGLLRGPVRIERAGVPGFLTRDWPVLAKCADITADFDPADFSLEPFSPAFALQLEGNLSQLRAVLQCTYGASIVTLGSSQASEGLFVPDPASVYRYGTRHPAAEQAAVGRLLRAGFSGPDAQGRWSLNGQDRVLRFLACEHPRLSRDWAVTLDAKLARATVASVERIEPRFEIAASGVEWFELGIAFESSGGHRLSPAEVQRLLLSGQGHTRLPSGKLALLDTGAVEELQEVLRDCAPEQQQGRYRLSTVHAGFIENTLREQGWQARASEAWRERAREWSGQARPACPTLGALDAVLRPYQKEGVAWLGFLRANGFGGILADEMGLGKTLQVLAHLRAVRQGSPALPCLAVVPSSLVFNWAAEAARFTPELRTLVLQGADRRLLFPEIGRHDLVITSYALVRRDLEALREHEFDTAILDEAQHIKNRQTQNAQAVKAIRSRHRLVLTGTPMENSVLDLWSIFDFLMPGYLGTAQEFKERYETPIARERDTAAQARLARRLRPFLLRRLKRAVATELPPKVEQVAYCELTEDQRAVYRQILEAGRAQMIEAAGTGTGAARMTALNALLRLRQICCDPRLVQADLEGERAASGKVELFSELLEETIDGGHRVLVFSQFVSMLTLLRQRLEAEGVEYCYLDGSTADRAGAVQRFQNGQAPVFLISLKAGGVGLNLAAADTVIHFDPWWNPAVEDQATDRAHRIGQTRVVSSYKLIARGTVEEKILQLQQRKRELIRAAVGGEEQFVEALSWNEIQELFGE